MKALWVLLACLGPVLARADGLEIDVLGVDEQLAANVEAHVGNRWVSGTQLSTERRRARFMANAKARAATALRPFGYYYPVIEARMTEGEDAAWRIEFSITPGEPITVRNLTLELQGEGADFQPLVDWREAWPLVPGARLVHPEWDEHKEVALDLAEQQGFLSARFTTQSIELDLVANRADLSLVLDTGPRATMGKVEFVQDHVEDGVLRPVPRFRPGDYYRSWLVDRLRTDLWKTGYWDEIDVVEQRRLDQAPPVVDFTVTLKPGKPDTHQGTIGFGTDTEFRMQYRWQRNRLSHRGDALSAGFGWQSRDEELLLFGEYRLPRQVDSQQYWLLSPIFRRENQQLDVEVEGEDKLIRLAEGRIEEYALRLGRVKLHNLEFSQEQLIETLFTEYLWEADDFDLSPNASMVLPPGELDDVPGIDLNESSRGMLSFGMAWDWPVVEGRGFQIRGHRERAQILVSNEAWGSDVDFNQIYLSSRWEIPIGVNWKVLLRGEAGYSDADVFDRDFEVDGRLVQLSITELPFKYRFRAGGSQSVRGYDFERLSTNNIGSNHILTASVELEYQFIEDWSAAVFYDVGNAFNDWDDPDLRHGYGAGIRWYTLAGAVRLDYAQARDIPGRPWQIHLTIGTPLL